MKKFDERLSRLEELAEMMRSDTLSLEESVKIFEEGIGLARTLQRDLEKIEGKVEILLNQPTTSTEKPELGLFDDWDVK